MTTEERAKKFDIAHRYADVRSAGRRITDRDKPNERPGTWVMRKWIVAVLAALVFGLAIALTTDCAHAEEAEPAIPFTQSVLEVRWMGYVVAATPRSDGGTIQLSHKDYEIGLREDGVLVWRPAEPLPPRYVPESMRTPTPEPSPFESPSPIRGAD